MGDIPYPWYWAARKGYYSSVHGKKNTLIMKCSKSKDNEKAAYEKLLKMNGQAQPIGLSNTVEQICDLFLEDVQANRAEATYGWFEERISKFLKRYPKLKVSELKPHHVTKWVNESPKNSDTTKRNKFTAIKRVFKWAKRQGHIDINPLAELEGITAGTRDQYVKPDEYREILTFVRDDQFRDLITVTFISGMRPQEILRCEARHFDKQEKQFRFPLKESKGKKRTRIVHLKDDALKIVTKLVAKYPSGPLFRNTDGEAWNSSSCGCQFSRLQVRMAKSKMRAQGLEIKSKMKSKQAAKYQKRFCLYDFRHGFAQAGLRSGVDSVIVGALMGHKDRSMVAKIYSHPDDEPKMLRDELKKIKTATAK